ncbi:hypothetical protein KR026_006489 [Drosophila bipectinata]|nr:hypothetical protein KR026_006489 [Drosophila bipectinata]
MAIFKKTSLCLLISLMWTLAAGETPIRQCELYLTNKYLKIKTNKYFILFLGATGSYPLPLMVQIDECDSSPCDLWKGSDARIDIQFVATRNTMQKLSAEVHLTSLGVTIPYDLEASRGNVCTNLLHGAYCPLDAGEDVTYELLLPVGTSQPEVPTRLEVRLLDSEKDNEVVACFLADTRVKKPTTS